MSDYLVPQKKILEQGSLEKVLKKATGEHYFLISNIS
jgi:hypothetical protein